MIVGIQIKTDSGFLEGLSTADALVILVFDMKTGNAEGPGRRRKEERGFDALHLFNNRFGSVKNV